MVDSLSDWSREYAQSTVRDSLARVVDEATPGLVDRLATDANAYEDLITVTNLVAEEADELLRETVISARHAGLSWEKIGSLLGISRQAAQQRFSAAATNSVARPAGTAGTAVGHMISDPIQPGAIVHSDTFTTIPGSPPIGTTATIDEASDDNIKMLNRAGQYGWRCIGFTTWTWTIEMTGQQWSAAATMGKEPPGGGWQRIGRYAFYVYWTRPVPAAPLPNSPNPEVFSSPKKFQKALDKQKRAVIQTMTGATTGAVNSQSLTGSLAGAIDKLSDWLSE